MPSMRSVQSFDHVRSCGEKEFKVNETGSEAKGASVDWYGFYHFFFNVPVDTVKKLKISYGD